MARPGEIKITVKNRQDSAQEKDYLFFTIQHTFPKANTNSWKLSENDTQADKELYQQFLNGLQFYPETARYD